MQSYYYSYSYDCVYNCVNYRARLFLGIAHMFLLLTIVIETEESSYRQSIK